VGGSLAHKMSPWARPCRPQALALTAARSSDKQGGAERPALEMLPGGEGAPLAFGAFSAELAPGRPEAAIYSSVPTVSSVGKSCFLMGVPSWDSSPQGFLKLVFEGSKTDNAQG